MLHLPDPKGTIGFSEVTNQYQTRLTRETDACEDAFIKTRSKVGVCASVPLQLTGLSLDSLGSFRPCKLHKYAHTTALLSVHQHGEQPLSVHQATGSPA